MSPLITKSRSASAGLSERVERTWRHKGQRPGKSLQKSLHALSLNMRSIKNCFFFKNEFLLQLKEKLWQEAFESVNLPRQLSFYTFSSQYFDALLLWKQISHQIWYYYLLQMSVLFNLKFVQSNNCIIYFKLSI